MRKPERFIQIAVTLLALILAPVPAGAASTTAGTYLAVAPAFSTACSSGQVAIQVQDVADLYAYDLQLSFTPGIIQVTSVENGSFLDSGLTPPTNGFDNTAGTITWGNAQVNPSEPKSGSGSLIVIHFNVLVTGKIVVFTIDPVNTALVKWPEASAIPFTAANGSVYTTCQPPHMVFLPLILR
jgi:hypothetical protein